MYRNKHSEQDKQRNIRFIRLKLYYNYHARSYNEWTTEKDRFLRESFEINSMKFYAILN